MQSPGARPVPNLGPLEAAAEKSISPITTPTETTSPSSDGIPDPTVGVGHDLETVNRVSSGPVYSTFSPSMRTWIITMCTFSSFFSPMTANIYFPAVNAIATDLGVSISLINLTITTYMVFQAIAPTVFGDFGDMAGRRPAFLVSFTIYLFANLGLALQRSYPALLVLRMLQSAGSSGTLALGFAVAADVSVSAERGKYMGYIGAGINIGPAISPVLGGVLAEYLGWRAIFWFCLILTGVWMVPFVVSVPETCRRVVGNGSVRPRGWNMTLIQYIRSVRRPHGDRQPRLRTGLPNPLRTLAIAFEKETFQLLVFNATLYLVFIIVVATLSPQFARIYELNDLQIGLCYLPYGVGCCLSAVGQGYLLDWNYRRVARKIDFQIDYKRGDDLSKFPIEKARIQLVLPMLAVGLVANAAYGWALAYRAPLAVPLVLVFLVGLTVTGAFSIIQTLIVDINPHAPATAVAAVNLVRCILGAAVMSFVQNMLTTMGQGGCYTFWSALAFAMTPMLFVVQRCGPRWREERRRRLPEEEKAAA